MTKEENKRNNLSHPLPNTKKLRSVFIIDIEIKDPNKIERIFHKLYIKLEDLFFNLIMKLPEKLIPKSLMEWMNKYLTRRVQQLKQETIKQTWRKM